MTNELFIKILFFLAFNASLMAQSAEPGAGHDNNHQTGTVKIDRLDFKNTDLRDVVRAIATKYNLNIFVENGIQTPLSLHLVDIPVMDALQFIADRNGLILERKGSILRFLRPDIPEPAPPPLDITYKNNKLTVNLKNEPVDKVAQALTRESGFNVVVGQGVHGAISGFLQDVPFKQGLTTLLNINGFSLRDNQGIFLIESQNLPPDSNGRAANGRAGRDKRFWIDVKDTLVSVDVAGASTHEVLQEIFLRTNSSLIMYEDAASEVTARFSDMPLSQTLSNLLRGTPLQYRREQNVYYVGGKTLQEMNRARLIRLNHLKVEQVMEMLPQELLSVASIKPVKEHNGFVVLAAPEVIAEIMSFVKEVDQPIPQVLIEALVLDLNRQKLGEFGIKASIGGTPDTTGARVNSLFPLIDVNASGEQINNILDNYGGGLGLSRITKLPANFYLQIKALENEGKANVRSRPQIATLNGHTASISIGTTQYFILKTETPISGTNQVVLQESERFETITAEMLLKVTPWVTATGEIIAEIRPEFSTPKNGLDSSKPPTIDHRILESTVKLKDGETIILGGLIQEFDSDSVTKFPILGSIPLLGKLFQSRSYNKTSAELIIYLTPHVYYVGDEMGIMQ